MKDIKFGVVLTGGATKGAFEVGALEYLLEHHEIAWISGTSIGAINGAGLASGTGIDEMKLKWKSLHKEAVLPHRPGFFSKGNQERVANIIKPFLKRERLEECKIPLIVNAKNTILNQETLFTRGSLLQTALASAALQPFFPPVKIDNIPYIDNMVISDFVDPRCDKILIIDLAHARPYKKHPLTFWIDKWLRTETTKKIESISRKKPTIVITLKKGIPLFDFTHTDELIRKGYSAARSEL